MNIGVFLKELKVQGVEVMLSDDRSNLRINYTSNNLSEVIINQLRDNKVKIIDYLKNANRVIPKAGLSKSGYPLTSSQNRSWILSKIEGYNYAYNMFEALAFEGDLDVKKLELAFKDLIEVHEILRTVFLEDEKGFVKQHVKEASEIEFKIEKEDFSGLAEAEEKVKSKILEEIKIIFDLSKGPLIRSILYRVNESKWIYLFVTHHIISDSRSFDVFKRDLLLAYEARLKGNTNGIQPSEIQYKDFAVWKDAMLKGNQLDKQKEYWAKQFEGEVPVLELPIDKKRPAKKTVEAGVVNRKINKELTDNFIKYCGSRGYTLFTGLMGLYNLLFYKYTRQTDIVLGFPIYGREYTELENVIGFFADTLALRTKFDGENSFEELLANVNKRAFDAYEHKDYTFEELISDLKPLRDSSRTILFDVFVVLQNFKHATVKEKEIKVGNLTIKEFKGESTLYSAFDLIINCSEFEDGLTCVLEYNKSIFNANTIEQLANHIEALMRIVLKNPNIPIKEIDLLSVDEKQKVLNFGGVKKKYSENIESVTESKNQNLDFSLYYFGNKGTEKNNYELLIEGAKYADINGYSAVWTPERHFNEFGGPYPNPSVLGASLAMVTNNVSIRSGSVVAPLHHPARIVEEWSVVDNLSNGRVGMCLASGWNANDFVLLPENYENRNELLYKTIKEIKELWKGNPISYKNANGEDKSILTFPRPLQNQPPIWIASGGSIETFERAGAIGAGILTMLTNTTFEELAEKIKIYRESYTRHNNPEGMDNVVLMLHTYIDKDEKTAKTIAKKPMGNYLSKSISMSEKQADSTKFSELTNGVSEEDLQEFLSFSVEKYLDKYSLIGTEGSCLKILDNVKKAGVDEVACLIDFGIEHDKVFNSLKELTKIKNIFNKKEEVVNDEIYSTSIDTPLSHKTVIDVFQEQTLRIPNKIALKFNEDELSYKELDERSNQVAHYLIQNEVKKGDVVAICLDRSMEMVIGMLGIMKSGAVYLPIDITYPIERVEYMLKDGGVKYVLGTPLLLNLIKEVKEVSFKTLFINEAKEMNAPKSQINLSEYKSEAYIIYTSGSTGKPKGVITTHKNLLSYFESIQDVFIGRHQDMRSPIIVSNTFDIFLFESLYPMFKGGTAVMISNDTIQNIESLLEELRKLNAFHCVPSLMAQLINHIKSTKHNINYSMIEDIFIGADVVSYTIIKEMKEVFPKANIHVFYGPTETTIYTTTHTIEKSTNSDEGKLLRGSIIGKPNTNVEVYILNNELQLSPVGVVGEICISGPMVSKGYVNKPEETKEKFVESPNKKGERIYKTGDLGRWLENGTIEFIGRKDQQVKIRGFRIELREIEYTLDQHEDIKLSCVVVKENNEGEKELIGYIVSDKKLINDKLRRALKQKLPHYMVPTHFIQLDKMPLNSNGKIDRKKVSSIEGTYLKSNRKHVDPRNEVDKKLIVIWKEVLEVDKIGIQDNFFNLGGNSLKATRLLNYLYKEFDLKLNLLTIFNTLTIEHLSDEINRLLLIEKGELETSDSENYII
ncbi:non-ribosomal peptide synthetase [Tenacibaculum discolor]|uniref:non-ribosomal peptide synthetase n=1 Tax=Tenacibaculum discolor TaxID=361581 RepID=UPI000F59FEE0|nr:non-ribosomal peptide synthetase [Tenacibaculum discolor]